MRLLTRNTSSSMFLTFGGLFSKKNIPDLKALQIPTWFTEAVYRERFRGFGPDEENVRRFLVEFFRDGLNWNSVNISHDILVTSRNGDKLLIECKRYDSRLLYLDDHKGGAHGETAVEELHRNLIALNVKWGILTDGATFRLYYSNPSDPTYMDAHLEISLKDIVDSTHRWPWEMQVLIDILSPESQVRQLDPTVIAGLAESHVRTILRCIRRHEGSLRTVLKALSIAALEDMGVRPLHTGVTSIRNVSSKREFNSIFSQILTDDSTFHSSSDRITDAMCADIHDVFEQLAEVDFAHVDHEFFGVIYQKFINNGNASHYTNTQLSKEMAHYISCQSERSQRQVRAISLRSNDYILDPAIGSGQLLRSLLPFHKVFFGGTTSGISGWRRLAQHFMGRDIDAEAIWLAKLNIWLSTASKGEPFIKLDEFKSLNVINATINRRAGESIKDALGVDDQKRIAACVSNPPWNAFQNDRRRGVTFDRNEVEKIRRSLGITSRQLNRAQIFLKIIHLLGIESNNMRFSIVLPDSFFVDQYDDLRSEIRANIDFYFSYPRNFDPITEKRIFPSVDNTRKFGIIFGRSQTDFAELRCYPFGQRDVVKITESLQKIGDFNVFPLLSHSVQAKIIEEWKRTVVRQPRWMKGEFDPSLWNKSEERELGRSGSNVVIGGDSFCNNTSAWSSEVNKEKVWNKFVSVSSADKEKRSRDRVIFSDYINNSSKKSSSSFLEGQKKCNVIDAVLYTYDCTRSDSFIYDSAVFSTFVECYATSQHMSAWRLSALGLPAPIAASTPLEVNVDLCRTLGLSLKEAMQLYDLNKAWLSLSVSIDEWSKLIGSQDASVEDQQQQIQRIKNIRKRGRSRLREQG